MVLQEAEKSAPDGFADEPYPSDNDPYAGSQPQTGQSNTIDIDMSKLPQPVPIIGPAIGYSRVRIAMDIKEGIRMASQLLRRPLNKGEADAIAYNTARAKSLASYGCAIGGAWGGYQCYRTRETWRFPFFTPPADAFNPDVCGPLRGQAARRAWHAIRAGPYVILASLLGAFVMNNYGALQAAVTMSTDPRLKDLNEELKKRAGERRGGVPQRPAPSLPRTPAQRQTPVGTGSKSSYGDEDDMSPTGGSYKYDFSGDPNSSTDTGILSDSQMRGQEVRQRADPRRSRTADRDTTFQMDKVTSQPSNYDDASPTGGGGSYNSTSSGGGSAWDRIRQQAGTGRGDTPRGSSRYPMPGNTGRGVQREQREGSTLGDSFSFSATEEERQLAKSEAQKEFDARIERERRGGDFEDAGKRW